jgi:hypothetical protein
MKRGITAAGHRSGFSGACCVLASGFGSGLLFLALVVFGGDCVRVLGRSQQTGHKLNITSHPLEPRTVTHLMVMMMTNVS